MPKIIELKTLTAAYSAALAHVTRILPEALPSGRGTWPNHQREAITAHLESANPGLALKVASMSADGRGGEAIDLLANAIAALEAADPYLFDKTPSREGAFTLACAWMNENPSPVGTHRRSYIFSNFADQMDSVRYANAYAQKHDIAARKTSKPRDFPARERTESVRSAPIDGGATTKGDDLEFVRHELPGLIGGSV